MKKRLGSILLAAVMVLTIVLSPLAVEEAFAAAKPGKAAISSVTLNRTGQPVIKWAKLDGVTGYRVFRKTSTDKKWVKVTTTAKTSVTDKKAKAKDGTDVQYRIRAYVKDAKGKVTWGKYSAVKTVAIPVKEAKEDLYPIEISEKNFPDPRFREYLIDLFSKGVITEKQAISLKEISVRDKGITSLKGIEFFPNLNTLSCAQNGLKELDVSKNTALETLYCSMNELETLDLSKNTKLKTLYCGYNKMTSVDFSHNTELIELDCNSLDLTGGLDVSHNTALEILYCSQDMLFELDLSKNTALKELDCALNGFSELDLSANKALVILRCSYNPYLEKLDLTRDTNLETLVIDAHFKNYTCNPSVKVELVGSY